MTKIKIKYERLVEVVNALQFIDTDKKDKLSWGAIQLANYLKPVVEKYQRLRNAILAETCSVDADGNFFLDKDNKPDFYKVTKENQKIREQKALDLLQEEVEIERFFVTDLTRIKYLSVPLIKLYNGILFNIPADKLEALFMGEDIKLDVSPTETKAKK